MSAREPAPGVIEGQTLKGEHELVADVCVVGSGPGGSVAAEALQRAGLKVVVLEEGGYFTHERFRMREEDAYVQLYQEGAGRTTKDLSVAVFQGRAVGGGSVVNWTTCFRTPAHVVAHWREKHDVKGFTHADLGPHWDAVEERLGIAEIPFESINENNKRLWDGCKALGYEPALLKRNVRGCLHTGYCGFGCPINAKQSMLVTYLPDAMNRGATVVSRCRVERLVSEGGRVVAAEGALLDALGIAPTGATLRVRAKRFIVSGGAINTPALLLRSALPDPHERVGLRTFLHPVVISLGLYDEPIRGFYGAPQSVSCHSLAERGDEVGFFLEAAPVHPSLGALFVPGFGVPHRQGMEQLANIGGHLAIAIDGFHDDVQGGRTVLRPSGRPLLDYTPEPRVWAALREAQKQLARVQLASGAKQVMTIHEPPAVMKSERDLALIDELEFSPVMTPVTSAHQMGGAGMSDDPRKGVVRSEDLRHHHVENLHVVDGSVFPTSLGVNPQESIYGLARLISTRLAAAWT